MVLFVLAAAVAVIVVSIIFQPIKKLSRYSATRKTTRLGTATLHSNGQPGVGDGIRDNNPDPEVIIVGSGIIGSAMAAVLAADGRKVTVIERDMGEPDRIRGEGMQPGGKKALQKLGLSECLDNLDSFSSEEICLQHLSSGLKRPVPYPADGSGSPVSLTLFHNGRFMMNLRRAAMERKANFVEGAVSDLIEEDGCVVGVSYQPKGEKERKTLLAPLTIVADGPYSKFRKQLLGSPNPTGHFMATLVNLTPDTDLSGKCCFEAIWCGGVPAYCYRIDSNTMRIMYWTVDRPTNPKQCLMDNVYPYLPERFQKAVKTAIEKDTLRMRMVTSLHSSNPAPEKPGVLLLGDALNSRNPISGCGMTVGLNDVILWRKLLANIESMYDRDALIDALVEFQSHRRRYSAILNVYSEFLYVLTVTNDRHLSLFARAGVHYLIGCGDALQVFTRTFGCMDVRPTELLYHFLFGSLFAACFIFKSAAWYAKPIALLDIPAVFVKSSFLLLSLVLQETGALTKVP